MKPVLTAANRRELDVNLRKVWDLGANVIIGWRLLPYGMKILYVTSYDLPKAAKNHPNLLRFDRFIDDEAEFERFLDLGCKASPLNLSFSVTKDCQDIVNEIIRRYTVTHFECRAVALFDIANFSIHSPFEQITQISVLSHYVKAAAQRCRSLGMNIDLGMTTTGDGFYVWNDNVGLTADIELYIVVMLSLGYNTAARKLAKTESVPRLRCAIHFGSHYEYYHPGSAGKETSGFIVGDVTIILARLISPARINQLLVGSHVRVLDDTEEEWRERLGTAKIDTLSFMNLAQRGMSRLVGLPIPGGKIGSIKTYFTGRRISDKEFSIMKYYIKDKHGIDHPCYNAKFNIVSSSNEKVYFGLLEKELGKFRARTEEDEDITIRIL